MNNITSNWWRKGYVLSATFLLSLLVITASCKKDKNLLGGNAIDQNNLLNSGGIDTFSLKTFTIERDSAVTSNPRFVLLGHYNDPELGTFKSGFYSQVRLSGLNPDFSGSIAIDSFVLALEYASAYGKVSTQNFHVYELDQIMYKDSTYYNFTTLTTSQSLMHLDNAVSLEMNPNKLTVVGNDTLKSQLRIHLDTMRAHDIIQGAKAGLPQFADDDLFTTNFFKGIYVTTEGGTPSSGNGNIGYFNLYDQDSKMIIYYKQNGASKFFDLRINEDCASFTNVAINNSGKYVQQVINDTISGQTEFYAQATKNLAAIDFPTLKNLPKNIVIHSAVLYLPVQHLSSSTWRPSSTITVFTAETFSFITNADFSSISNEYAIDLRAFIQSYISGNVPTPAILLSPSSYSSSAERIVFNGPQSTNKKKPKLVLTYTEF